VIEFTESLSNLTAKEFIQNKLAGDFSVEALLIGYDHKFGKGRVDGFNEYKEYGKECGVKVFHAKSLTEEGIRISSTVIRNLLTEGDVKQAASILTYNYTLDGIVINGNKLGREMGFPTANIGLIEENKIIPRDGIYATWVYIKDERYKGMSYIGKRPSLFARGEQRIETHILDFEGDLYGERLKLEFVEYMRDDMKFEFIEDLNQQLMLDKEMTQRILDY
jgi:riboflavin kinase/FMN adenylyltransferase